VHRDHDSRRPAANALKLGGLAAPPARRSAAPGARTALAVDDLGDSIEVALAAVEHLYVGRHLLALRRAIAVFTQIFSP
jgi:hypothetical protein